MAAGGDLGRRRRLALAWNLFGFADILLVVAAATHRTLADPRSRAPLFRLPLSLLPTFVVPLIISHVVLLQRLLGRAGSGRGEG